MMNILERIKQRARSFSIANQLEITENRYVNRQNARLYGLTAIFFIGYAVLFYLITQSNLPFDFPKSKITRLGSRVGSSLHAAAIFTASLLYLLRRINLATFRNLLCISIAFFTFDCITAPYYAAGMVDLLYMIVHHGTVLLCITGYSKKYPKLVAQGLLAEVTAPFTYACWFLIKLNKQDTVLFQVLGIFTLVTWAVARVINFTLMYRNICKKKLPLAETLLFLPVVLMNYYWFVKIVKKWLF